MFLGDACVMKRDVCAYSNGSRKRNAHKANLIMINDTMTILILQQLINPKFSPKPPKKKLQNSPKPTSWCSATKVATACSVAVASIRGHESNCSGYPWESKGPTHPKCHRDNDGLFITPLIKAGYLLGETWHWLGGETWPLRNSQDGCGWNAPLQTVGLPHLAPHLKTWVQRCWMIIGWSFSCEELEVKPWKLAC